MSAERIATALSTSQSSFASSSNRTRAAPKNAAAIIEELLGAGTGGRFYEGRNDHVPAESISHVHARRLLAGRLHPRRVAALVHLRLALDAVAGHVEDAV